MERELSARNLNFVERLKTNKFEQNRLINSIFEWISLFTFQNIFLKSTEKVIKVTKGLLKLYFLFTPN